MEQQRSGEKTKRNYYITAIIMAHFSRFAIVINQRAGMKQ